MLQEGIPGEQRLYRVTSIFDAAVDDSSAFFQHLVKKGELVKEKVDQLPLIELKEEFFMHQSGRLMGRKEQRYKVLRAEQVRKMSVLNYFATALTLSNLKFPHGLGLHRFNFKIRCLQPRKSSMPTT